MQTVILQQQSAISGYPRESELGRISAASAAQLQAHFRQSGLEVWLLMTWAWRNGWRTRVSGGQTGYLRMQHDVVAAYEGLAQSTWGDAPRMKVIPAGLAWERVFREDRARERVLPLRFEMLYTADGSHPSVAGSYLTACVVYASLTGDSPVGLPAVYPSLSQEQVDYLQTVAWQTVEDWRIRQGGQSPPAEGASPPSSPASGRLGEP